jgi:hypothetical protein
MEAAHSDLNKFIEKKVPEDLVWRILAQVIYAMAYIN